MTYFDRYKKRLGALGPSESDSLLNNSINFINREFKNSPSYKLVKINGVDTDVRFLLDEVDSNKCQFIFRPGQGYGIGTYIVDGTDTWIAVEEFDHKLSPGVTAYKCNSELKWQVGTTIFSYPCYVVSNSFNTRFDGRYDIYVYTPTGEVSILVQSNQDTKSIKLSQRFILGSQPFLITGIDDLYRKGLIRFTANLNQINNQDDFNNKLAENDIPQQREGWDRLL